MLPIATEPADDEPVPAVICAYAPLAVNAACMTGDTSATLTTAEIIAA